MKKNSMAFDFVLEELHDLNPVVRPMFGCHAIYVGDAIVLITRNKKDHTEDNGVWIATQFEYHESFYKELPLLRNVKLLGGAKSNWQNIPVDEEHFEESVFKVCELIRKRDNRIGKIPKPRKHKRN